MPGSIKRHEVWTDEAFKSPDDFNKKLKIVLDTLSQIITQGKAMSSAFASQTGVKTLNDGIKKQNELINKGNTARTKAISLAEQRNKIIVQTKNNFTKLLASEGKEALVLEKSRQAVNKNNRERKLAVLAAAAQKGSYDAISAALSANLIKYKKMSQAEREATGAGKQLEAAILRQRKALTQLDSRLGNHTRKVGTYQQAIARSARTLVGALGFTGGILALVNVMKGAFNTLRSFTKENAVLAGVLGTTRDQVGELTDQQIRLGSVYPITASEVAKLQVSYARLGFTQSEIINLTEATIQGSIALNAELDKTALLVGAVVRAFDDLGTADSGRIIDVLTLATQKSSQSFATLETALPKVAAAANAMGISLETVVDQLGTAQDATLDASISGTSLRNIYLELAKSGMTLEEALAEINGSSNRLRTSFELFGKRAAIVGLALAKAEGNATEFDKALDTVGGTAERVAEEQMATLDGSIKGLESSWEKFILQVRGSESTLSGITDFFANILDAFTSANDVVGPTSGIFWATVFGLDDEVRESAQAKVDEFNKTTLKELRKSLHAQQDLRQDARKEGDDLAELAATNAVIRIHNRIEELSKIEEEAAARELLALQNKELAKIGLENEAAEKRIENAEKEAKDKRKILERESSDFLRRSEALRKLGSKTRGEDRRTAQEWLETGTQLEVEKLEERNEKVSEINQTTFDNEIARRKDQFAEEERIQQEKTDRIVGIAVAMGDSLGALASSEIKSFKDFSKEILLIALDALEKRILVTQVSILAGDIVTKGFAGIATAAIKVAAIKAAFAGVAGIIRGFEKGTENAPAGVAEVAEKGRELWIGKHGVSLVEKRSIVNLSQGDVIKNNHETEKIIKAAEMSGSLNYDSPILKSKDGDLARVLNRNNAELIETIRNKKELNVSMKKGRVQVTEKEGNYYKTYLNKFE